MSLSISLYEVTIPVYIRQLKNFVAVLTKSRDWCTANHHPETFLTEAKLAPDMQPLHFQVQVATCMIRSGIFGPQWKVYTVMDEADHERDFPGMIQRLQTLIDELETLKPGYEGDAQNQEYTFWPSGKPGVGEPSVFASASNFLSQFVLPNFYFHLTTAYDICRSQGVPLGKVDFLLSAGPFS